MNNKNRILIFWLVLILATLACNRVISTPTPTSVPPTATKTAIPTPTLTPKPSLTSTSNAEECFSLETLAYENELFKLYDMYSAASEKAIADLKSGNLDEIQNDADTFLVIIDALKLMKPTPILMEYHKYFVAEVTTYHDGLQMIADGNQGGYGVITNGDEIYKKRIVIGDNFDRLCYPDRSTPSSSG